MENNNRGRKLASMLLIVAGAAFSPLSRRHRYSEGTEDKKFFSVARKTAR